MQASGKDEVNEARAKFMIELARSGHCFKKMCLDNNLVYSTLRTRMYDSKYFDLEIANFFLEKMGSSYRFNNKIQFIKV